MPFSPIQNLFCQEILPHYSKIFFVISVNNKVEHSNKKKLSQEFIQLIKYNLFLNTSYIFLHKKSNHLFTGKEIFRIFRNSVTKATTEKEIHLGIINEK